MFPELPFLPRLVQTFWPFARPARDHLAGRVEPPPLRRPEAAGPNAAAEPRATLLRFPSAAIDGDRNTGIAGG